VTTLPGRALRAAAHAYVDRLGWAVFTERLGPDGQRRTVPNCDACRAAGWEHDAEICDCLLCHGFYAATKDHGRVDRMFDRLGDENVALCARTGHASGILVVDFDEKHGAPEAFDRWPEATGLEWWFRDTLRQRTRSGGFHLIYRLPADAVIRSRDAVSLRGVDVKAEGGLVVIAPTPGYAWLNRADVLTEPSDETLRWATEAGRFRGDGNGAGGGHGGGGPVGNVLGRAFEDAVREGIPAGRRDPFINTLLFQLRKRGASREEALAHVDRALDAMEHPDGDRFRREWCVAKLERVWRTVQPDPVDPAARRWVAALRPSGPGEGEQARRVGSVTLVGWRART
jgi:hypothetical protein